MFVSSVSKTVEKNVNMDFCKNLGGKFINQILEIVDHVKGNPYDFLLKIS